MALNKNGENLVTIATFNGGLNDSLDDSLLPINQSKDAMNIDINNGVFEPCKLEKMVKDYRTHQGNEISEIFSISPYYKNGDLFFIISAKTNSGKGHALFECSSITWNIKFIEGYFYGKVWSGVNNNIDGKDVIILTNNRDKTKVWDGTTLRDLKMNGKDSAESASNKAPHGNFIEMHYERLWIADNNNLYASSVTRNGFDIDDWTTPTEETEANQHGVHMFAYSNDGSVIRGLKLLFGNLVIFKDKSIMKIFGSDPSNYQKVDLMGTGSMAQNSIVVTPVGAFFVNYDGIFRFDGTNVDFISGPINELWNRINKDRIENIQGAFFNNKYILSISLFNNKNNDAIIEYDIYKKTFMLRGGINVNGFCKEKTKLLFFEETAFFEYDSELKNKGFNKTAYWETPSTDFGYPNAVKEISTVYLEMEVPKEEAGENMTVSCKTEKKEKMKIVSLIEGKHIYRVNINNIGRIVNFRFSNVNFSRFKLKIAKAIVELDED